MKVHRSRARDPVVTGVGVVTPIGSSAEQFWHSLIVGRDGVRPLRAFPSAFAACTVACDVEDVPEAPRTDVPLTRASALAVAAAKQALSAAGVTEASIDALCVGTTMGDLAEPDAVSTDGRNQTQLEPAAFSFGERIAEALHLRGAAFTLGTACSAGNLAICRAAELIRIGRARRVLAGGADALSRMAFAGFARMQMMAADRCAPFDRERSGMLLGEGAGFVVLEARRAAERRGAAIHALVAGVGYTCDAHHISTPLEGGRGVSAALRSALADARLDPADVDYVCAHGTGTRHSDLAEARGYATVFGAHRPLVSSVKALIGHTLGAAGAIDVVACVLALREQRLIPAWNIRDPDPACDVRLALPSIPQHRRLTVAVNVSSAFGGNNSAVVLKACS